MSTFWEKINAIEQKTTSGGGIYKTDKEKKRTQLLMVGLGGVLTYIVVRAFMTSSRRRRNAIQSNRNRKLAQSIPNGAMKMKAYNHGDNEWIIDKIPYLDWSGHQTVYFNTKQCIRGLNWFMEPISVCPSPNLTFLITDELTKRMYEDISVRIVGTSGQKMTVVA